MIRISLLIFGLLIFGLLGPTAIGSLMAQKVQLPVTQGVQTPGIERIPIAGLASYIAQCDHPLIVNFWATFCSPCIKEIPWLQNTVARYKGVELILVSLDRRADYPARIIAFARKNDVSVRILWLSGTNADTVRSLVDPHWSGGLPSSLFINNASRYRRFFDRQLTEPQVELAVKELLR